MESVPSAGQGDEGCGGWGWAGGRVAGAALWALRDAAGWARGATPSWASRHGGMSPWGPELGPSLGFMRQAQGSYRSAKRPQLHSLAGELSLRSVGLGRGAAWGGLTDASAPAGQAGDGLFFTRTPRQGPLSVRQRWTRGHRSTNMKRSGFPARGGKRLRSAGKVPRR